MKIWFHGTNLEAAEQIGRKGFRAGTWFAKHLEDAIEFGGEVVFEVALDHKPLKQDNWQMCVWDEIPIDAVVSITHYHPDRTLKNEELRNQVFESNRT